MDLIWILLYQSATQNNNAIFMFCLSQSGGLVFHHEQAQTPVCLLEWSVCKCWFVYSVVYVIA
jgi:hypothetical protein